MGKNTRKLFVPVDIVVVVVEVVAVRGTEDVTVANVEAEVKVTIQ